MKIKISGCKKATFLNQATKNGGQAIFYVLKCWDKEEQFYKIGISVNHILTRYGSVKSMPYEWQILYEYPDDPEAIYDLEVQFKTEMNEYHYQPKIAFNGSKSECYTQLSETLQQLIQ